MATASHLRKHTQSWLTQPAPIGYVAGLGRGASGFTTRSDIGPARETASQSIVDDARNKRRKTGRGRLELNGAEAQEDGDGVDEDGQFDDAAEAADAPINDDPDNETGLFAGMPVEQDDIEADAIYEAVDARMEKRRRQKTEPAKTSTSIKENMGQQAAQFSDLKAALGSISEAEWSEFPEGTHFQRKGATAKKRAAERERSYAVPDSVIMNAYNRSSTNQTADSLDAADGTSTNFLAIGQANNRALSLKLDQANIRTAKSGLETTIDPRGYLTSLNASMIRTGRTESQIDDMKKARELLQNLTKTNPKRPDGWIGYARLEEMAGKPALARKIIYEGCLECSKNQEIWIEAARLNSPENAKVILAEAVKSLPTSPEIWLTAMRLESERNAKRRVIRKALELIPESQKLWEEAIDLEEPAEARMLLPRAVELLPFVKEFWLALARLETPERAKAVLNKALKANPTSYEIWIAAAKLQEESGNGDQVDMIIHKGIMSLAKKGALISREAWFKEAERAEDSGNFATCASIVKYTIGMEIEPEDRKTVWMEDAQNAFNDGFTETARAVYLHALRVFPSSAQFWRAAAELEKSKGTRENFMGLLEKAVGFCPKEEVLWLIYAKEKWLAGDVVGARSTLEDAFRENSDSEQIWLAAVKLEHETGRTEAARKLMDRAKTVANTERIWLKAAVFERQLGQPELALATLQEACQRFPTFDKLWMVKGQIYEAQAKISDAREAFAKGLQFAPRSVPLWLLASRLEERANLTIKARALLERARLLNPKDERVWLESVQLEKRVGVKNNMGTGQAKSILAKALHECPNSGMLWAESIWLETRTQRLGRAVEGLKKTENDAHVILAAARLFWADRKIDKARDWFKKCVKADPDMGDAWAYWFAFECQHGSAEEQNLVLQNCVQAEPHHSPRWQSVRKSDENANKSTGDILKLVSVDLLHQPSYKQGYLHRQEMPVIKVLMVGLEHGDVPVDDTSGVSWPVSR